MYEQYKYKSDEELKQIIASDNYEQYAKDIAAKILNGDRSEYYQKQDQIEQAYIKANTPKIVTPKILTVNDAIFQIAKDVRFIRNVIAAALCATAVSAIIFLIMYIANSL